jgi:uncharacterized protein
MAEHGSYQKRIPEATRRGFLKQVSGGVAGAAATVLDRSQSAAAGEATQGKVGYRILGKTGLKVSEIGFGGHSWNFARIPDGRGGLRRVTLEEAMRMIAIGLEMGVNFFDSCTPLEEHSVPGEVIKRLKKRDEIVVSARLCHKMMGVAKDKEIVYRWVEERLRLWQTDRFDLLMLTNTENDTPLTGYWDMSYCLEAIDKLKKQGKIRFAGFGCHFAPERFMEAFQKYGKAWDVCSVPYNVRHRAAEALIPEAKKLDLGIVAIKPLARGELLQGLDPKVSEGLARDMIAFVLENRQVDCCICGVHTEAHVRENLSAAWTKLTPERRRQLERIAAAATACREHAWLERGWRC